MDDRFPTLLFQGDDGHFYAREQDRAGVYYQRYDAVRVPRATFNEQVPDTVFTAWEPEARTVKAVVDFVERYDLTDSRHHLPVADALRRRYGLS